MYTPKSFEVSDLTLLHEFIEQYSFATLVTCETLPAATHLPLLLERTGSTQGRLIGHMARANPQWRTQSNVSALAIFHGPHAYISPTWINEPNVVPTWNYVTVHAYGTIRILDDPKRVRQVLVKTTECFEAANEMPWTMEQSDADYIDRLIPALVAFELDIERLEGKWKLSQNHSRERREQIIEGLKSSGGVDELQVARLMEQSLRVNL